MDVYTGFEDLTFTLITTLGVITGTFLGFDSNTNSHIMSINGEVASIPADSIISLITTSSFQLFDEPNRTVTDVNMEPGAIAHINFRGARTAASIQQQPAYGNWDDLSKALTQSIQ